MFKRILQVYNHLDFEEGAGRIIQDFSALFDRHKIENSFLSVTVDKKTIIEKSRWVSADLLEEIVRPDTLVIYHYAFQTPLVHRVSRLSCPKVLQYHNITPPEFFEPYHKWLKDTLVSSLREVAYMAHHFSYAWGDSEYNCSQLRQVGFIRTATAPPPYDFERFLEVTPSRTIKKDKEIKDILFVGRIAPNKRQEDIIRAFFYYHRINPKSRLTLVGDSAQTVKYTEELVEMIEELNIPVTMTGKVAEDELVAHYMNADLFLCMSEHEGFCIPLIEAMYFGVPIIAFDSSAVTETVGNAGIVFHQKHFTSVAHLMDIVLRNPALQDEMREAGKKRAQYFDKENLSEHLIGLIADYAVELGV